MDNAHTVTQIKHTHTQREGERRARMEVLPTLFNVTVVEAPPFSPSWKIHQLDLSSCWRLKDIWLQSILTSLSNSLSYLNLSNCWRLTDSAFEVLVDGMCASLAPQWFHVLVFIFFFNAT